MTSALLENLMIVARDLTQAERGVIVDKDLNILKLENVDTAFLESNEYIKFAKVNLQQAIVNNEAIIGNNVIQDMSAAPTTNTNFANLRMALVLPVVGHGAIYLDRPIRSGVISKNTVDRLMNDPGIIRNRAKVTASIANAQAWLKIMEGGPGSFDRFLWKHVGFKTKVNHWKSGVQLPATSPESDAMSKDLKQHGFKFVGSTIVYAFMQACGMVDDHLESCWRRQ